MENKNQKLWIMLGVLAVIVIIIIVAVLQGKKAANPANNTVSNNQPGTTAPTGTSTSTGTTASTGTSTPQNNALKDAVAVVPGSNPISKDNKVLTLSGEVTKTNVSAASPVAPQQTLAIAKELLPASVIKLEASKEGGFTPNSFTVKAGAAVTVSITNKDTANSVTLAFTDPTLVGLVMGAGPSETRAISFNAPTKAGEYQFIDGIPGHSGTGKMIVQ